MTTHSSTERDAQRITEWVFLSICIGFTLVIARWWLAGTDTFQERLGLSNVLLVPWWAWLFAAVVATSYCAYTLTVVPDVRRNALRWSRLKALGLWAALVSGIVEEVVFRHLLMDGLAGHGWATTSQVVVSAIVFGAAHTLWVLLSRDWRIILPVVTSTATLGVLLALLYLASDRSTLPAIAAHTTVNMVIEPWLIMAAITGTWYDSDNTPATPVP